MLQRYLIIDFDSTLVKTETFIELAAIISARRADDVDYLTAIEDITNRAMLGELSFYHAVLARLKLLKVTQQDIHDVTQILSHKITTSFLRQRDFLQQHAANIYIFSGGFSTVIIPIANKLGITADHVFANKLLYDERQNVIGIDTKCFLAHDHGKLHQLQALHFSKKIFVIGDGSTDLEMAAANNVERCYLFTENVYREALANKAASVINSFDEIVVMLS